MADTWVAQPKMPLPLTPDQPTRARPKWALICFILSLLLYGTSLCQYPYADFDCSELICCAAGGGLPHPTGYPLYQVLGSLFAPLVPGNPAKAINAMSALFGALTIALVYLIAARLTRNSFLAFFAAMLLATCRDFWLLSIVAEVYSLHCFLLTLCLYLLMLWHDEERGIFFLLAVLALSAGMCNHATTIFLVPAILLFMFVSRRFPSFYLFLFALLIVLCVLWFLYLVYLPKLAVSADPGPWARFMGLSAGPSRKAVIDYVTGAIYRGREWRAAAIPAGLRRIFETVLLQFDLLPGFDRSFGDPFADGLVDLLRCLLFPCALFGLFFHYKGQAWSFTVFAGIFSLLTLFYSGMAVSVLDIESMLLPLYFCTALWIMIFFKGLLLLGRDGRLPAGPRLLYPLLFLLCAVRTYMVYPQVNLHHYKDSIVALGDMLHHLPGDAAVIADWQHANLLRYGKIVDRRAKGLEIFPYSVISRSLNHRYGVRPGAPMDRQWKILADRLLQEHGGRIYTTLLNARALSPFLCSPVPNSRQVYTLRPAPAPSFILPDEIPSGLEKIDIDAGFGLRLAAFSPVTDPLRPGQTLPVDLLWEKRKTTAGSLTRVLLRVRSVQGRILRLSTTENKGFISWTVGRGYDLSEWPEGALLYEQRTIQLAPDKSGMEAPAGRYIIEIKPQRGKTWLPLMRITVVSG